MDLTLDYETRSPVSLKDRGVFVYSAHPATELMCLAAAIDNETPKIWLAPHVREIIEPSQLRYPILSHKALRNAIEKADRIIAHNSMFEYKIADEINPRYNLPKIPLEKMHDTMAQCGYHALPLGMGEACEALSLPVKKDKDGHKVMLKLCKPRKATKKEAATLMHAGWRYCESEGCWRDLEGNLKYLYHEGPEDLIKLANYCGRDVEAERLLYRSLAPLPEWERKIWLMDQRINLRGVPIDIDSVQAIVSAVERREEEQQARFRGLTEGQVSGPRSYVALRNWVIEQTGLEIDSLDKNATEELLKNQVLPGHVEEVLRIKAELSKSSVAKLRAMLECVSADGRLRGMFQYFGASTGRWAGRKVQLHNQPRDSYKPTAYELAVDMFKKGDLEALSLVVDDAFYAASRCVRGSICTSDVTEFICSDFSSIENIVDFFLAGDFEALEVFRKGLDNYIVFAVDLFGKVYKDISEYERQVGKCGTLALCFLGGIGAFATMSKTYKVNLETLPALILPRATDDELDGEYGARAMAERYIKRNPDVMSLDAAIACDVIKQKWRAQHPAVVEFGRSLEWAARAAIDQPGTIQRARGIKYCVHNRFLKCMLPSGRLIHYYLPRVKDLPVDEDEDGEIQYKKSITYMGLRVADGKTTRQWTRLATYSGKLLENVVQATARDLLCHAMLNLEAAKFPIVLHVHDEAAAEVVRGTRSLDAYNKVMTRLPSWAQGLPVKAEGWVGARYRK